jgi:hypothetical protein
MGQTEAPADVFGRVLKLAFDRLSPLPLVPGQSCRATHRLLGVTVFILNGDDWDLSEDREGWRTKDAWVGRKIGAHCSVRRCTRSNRATACARTTRHHANEEWLIVLRGEPTLRTPEGEQAPEEGDVVCFLRGKEDAHQVINRTASPIRVLMLSTMIVPDIVEYLDSGKIEERERRADHARPAGAGARLLGRRGLAAQGEIPRRRYCKAQP